MSRSLPLPTPVCFPAPARHSSRARALVRAAMLIAILPALVLFSSSLVQATPKNAPVMVSLEGTVTDHLNSDPVEDAHVELRDASTNRVVADTQTGADGKFLLVNLALAPGRYFVRVSLAAYKREEQNLKIEPTTKQVPPILFAL